MIAHRVCLLAILSLPCSVAAAGPDAVARAERLFDEAKALMQSNDYAQACDKLEESQRLDPQLGTRLHLAYCYEKGGKLARAYLIYRDVERLAAQRKAGEVAEPREELARERSAKLAPQLGVVEVRPAEPTADLQITLDDTAVDRARWADLVVDPGAHTVRASAPGRQAWQQTFTSTAAARQLVIVPALLPLAAADRPALTAAPASAPSVPLAAAPGSSAASSRIGLQRVFGYVGLGVGIVGVGLGTALGLMRNAAVSDLDTACDLAAGTCAIARGDSAARARIESLRDDASTYATGANVSLILGGLAVAGGLTLVLTAPRKEAPSVTLGVAPSGLTLTARANGM